jgi:hypothetical protein
VNKFYLDERYVNLMPRTRGFWTLADGRKIIFVDTSNSKRGVAMTPDDNLGQAIALLKKINVNVLPEGSRALYEKSMGLLEGIGEEPTDPDPAGEETPKEELSEDEMQDAAIAASEAEELADVDATLEPGFVPHAEEAAPTADEVMEEKLEAETDESVGQEPQPEEVKPE